MPLRERKLPLRHGMSNPAYPNFPVGQGNLLHGQGTIPLGEGTFTVRHGKSSFGVAKLPLEYINIP